MNANETPEAKANREYYERFEKEEDRLYARANMAEQLFIKLIAGFNAEPTAQVVRQFKRRAEKAATIYYELPKPKKVKQLVTEPGTPSMYAPRGDSFDVHRRRLQDMVDQYNQRGGRTKQLPLIGVQQAFMAKFGHADPHVLDNRVLTTEQVSWFYSQYPNA